MSLKLPKRKKRSKSGRTVLIDMDIPVYSIGFACQKDGEVEPIENCLHSVKVFLDGIIEATGAEFVKGYLTGKNNFRKDIATITEYKAGRADKPVYYEQIRKYMVEVWAATVVDGAEADDYLAIELSKGCDVVLASLDKDLLQVPGLHFQWNKPEKGVFHISEEEGIHNLYYQALVGDSVDCIMGCGQKETLVYKSGKRKGEEYSKRVGVGPVQAEKILEDCKTELELYEAVRGAYEESSYENPYEAMVENMHLLFMLRELNEDGSPVHWEPPHA